MKQALTNPRACATGTPPDSAAIGHAAALALHDELALSPKPGLVTLLDSGSHDDMDGHTFMRSLFALRPYFVQMADAGRAGESFAVLEQHGMAAEACMLRATQGINTHRGAIFMLGLLCAAAGSLAYRQPGRITPGRLRAELCHRWGDTLLTRSRRPPTLPGGIVTRQLGLRGASEEAASGFPVVFGTAVPMLVQRLAAGWSPHLARLDTLFAVMAVLDDSNIAHRGGLAGLHHVQMTARQFMAQGGSAAEGGLAAARAIAAAFVARRLSPGGAADTLAAACLVVRLCGAP